MASELYHHTLFSLLALSVTVYLQISPATSRSPLHLPPECHVADDLFCGSWKFAVDTNDAPPWRAVPERCEKYVKGYMKGGQYASDSDVVARLSAEYAKEVALSGDGNDVWIFDVDDTLLSNLPFYEANGYGTESFNQTKFNAWVEMRKAPALPASLKLYKKLKKLGFKLILLTGRDDKQRTITEKNLHSAGYSGWERLIMRGLADQGKPARLYKSEKRLELVAEGYRLHGSSGDQWSDLQGFVEASRSFKLPNPLYYVP